jgi:hypothetical protein
VSKVCLFRAFVNSSMRRGAQYDERTMYSVPMDGSGSLFVLDDDKAQRSRENRNIVEYNTANEH